MAKMIRDKRKSVRPQELTFVDLSAQTKENMEEINKLYGENNVHLLTMHLDETRNKFFRFQIGGKYVGAINLLEQDGDWFIIPFVDDNNIHRLGEMTSASLNRVKAKEGHLTVIECSEVLAESLIANEYEPLGSYESEGARKDIFRYSI